MLFIYVSRIHLLQLMPTGGTIAEIGVSEGEFSADILSLCKPSKLHLIDPWEHQENHDYLTDQSNVSQEEHQKKYLGVAKRFAQEIQSGQVQLHRQYSADALVGFPDGYFDWVYIDGIHTKEGVLQDLALCQQKVKKGGLILGHDYANHMRAQEQNFGVIEAVDEFVEKNNYAFLAMTFESYPTFVLCDSDQSPVAQQLTAMILYNVNAVMKLQDFPHKIKFSQVMLRIQGRNIFLPCFK